MAELYYEFKNEGKTYRVAFQESNFMDMLVIKEYCPRRPFFKWKEVAEYVYQLMKYNFLIEAGMLSTNPAVMYETMRFTANDFVHHEEKQKKADIQRRAQMKYALDKCK